MCERHVLSAGDDQDGQSIAGHGVFDHLPGLWIGFSGIEVSDDQQVCASEQFAKGCGWRERVLQGGLIEDFQPWLSEEDCGGFDLPIAFEQVIEVAEFPAGVSVQQQDASFVIDDFEAEAAGVVVAAEFTGAWITGDDVVKSAGLIGGQCEGDDGGVGGGSDVLLLNDGAIGFESDGELFAFETGGPEDGPDECLIPEEDGFGCIDGGDGEVAGLQGGADGYGVDGDIDHGEQLCGSGDVSGCSLSSVGEDDEGADLAGGFFGEGVLEESDGIGGCGQQFTAFGLQLLCELQWCGLQLFGGEQSEIEREIFAEIFEELRGSGGEQSAGEFGAGHLIEFAE